MPTIFIGLLALALMLWLLKSFAHTDPKYLIGVGRTAGGIVALAGAAFLGVRGRAFGGGAARRHRSGLMGLAAHGSVRILAARPEKCRPSFAGPFQFPRSRAGSR